MLAALVLVYLLYFQQPRMAPSVDAAIQTGAVETSSRPLVCGALEGQNYNFECQPASTLVWRHCAAGTERELSFNCSNLQSAGEEGYCNPRGKLPDGSTGANCAYRRSTATATVSGSGGASEPTDYVRVAVPTPTVSIRSGPSYCGDGVCDSTESCASCGLDCGCGLGLTCQQATGVCVRSA